MINRRDFIKSGVLASSAMVTASTVSTTPIRCGFLGINHAHGLDALRVVKSLSDYILVGVCEPNEKKRLSYSEKPEFKNVRWVSKNELLKDSSIQLIVVESDVSRLLEYGLDAIRAGKHIHLDKPAGTDLSTFRTLLTEAENKNLLVQMGYMFRYNPGFDLIKRALQKKWLGEIYSIHASMCTYLNPEKRRQINFHSGGVMLELGCHLIDIIVVLLGEPKKVSPFIRHDADIDDSLADNALAILEYDKSMVTVETAAMETNAFGARRFKICGTQGSIILSPLEPPKVRISLNKPRGEFKSGVTELKLPDLARHRLDFLDLARCIRGEADFGYTKSHDLSVQKTILAACGIS
jgi:predicted dehydrogenase